MTTLAFDTTGAVCAAAVVEADGVTRAMERIEMARGQADAMIPQLRRVLAAAECAWDELERIAVCVGPGSFTGVRVGVAAARGLALALDRPAIGVTAFEALAADDAAPGSAAYVIGKPAMCAWALRGDLATVARGPASEAMAAPVERWIGPDPLTDDPRWRRAEPSLTAIAALARNRDGAAEPPAPFYLRPPDAAPSQTTPPARLDRAP